MRDVKNKVASVWRGNRRFCLIQKRLFRCECMISGWNESKTRCATFCEIV